MVGQLIFLFHKMPSSGAHPASCSVDIRGFFLGVNWLGH